MNRNNDTIPEQLRSFIWKQGFALGNIQNEEIIDSFIAQMNTQNKKSSSLAMLPSFLKTSNTLQFNKKFIAIDAGGSNLRCALISFHKEKGAISYSIEKQHSQSMPGVDHLLSKIEFFEKLFECIEPLLNASDTIGFCFSYPCEISENLDGRLIRWTKEITAPEVEGEWIGQALNELLQSKGYASKKIILLNDTVATLLAGKLETNSVNASLHANIGLILGTGTNCAFNELTGQQVINIESGNFNGTPLNQADTNLDAYLTDKGNYSFEKKIAGRYLGNLCLELFLLAANEGLFSEACSASIKAFTDSNQFNLPTKQLNYFFEEGNSEKLFEMNDSDLQTVQFLIDSVIERASLFSALQLFAIAKKLLLDANIQNNDENSEKEDKQLHIDINIDGSTFYQLHEYQNKIIRKLSAMMGRQGISFRLLKTEDPSLLGAAVAAASLVN
jgi:hexokinase